MSYTTHTPGLLMVQAAAGDSVSNTASISFLVLFNGTLSLSADHRAILAGGTVHITVNTSPVTPALGVVLKDLISSTTIATGTTDASGSVTMSYMTHTPGLIVVQAAAGDSVSVSNTASISFRDSTGKNTVSDDGKLHFCAQPLLTTQVHDNQHQPGVGSVFYFANGNPQGSLPLDSRGQTMTVDVSSIVGEDLTTYYSGSTSWANVNTWIVC